jgi:hypothetical protein
MEWCLLIENEQENMEKGNKHTAGKKDDLTRTPELQWQRQINIKGGG